MFCLKCRSEVDESASFCGKFGGQIAQSIVGVTGRLYKTTTEGYMYDIYMEVEEFE